MEAAIGHRDLLERGNWLHMLHSLRTPSGPPPNVPESKKILLDRQTGLALSVILTPLRQQRLPLLK